MTGTSFEAVPTRQVGLLHRHWIWANHARRTFDETLANDDREDVLDFASRRIWAMYLWYGLIYTVIEGLTDRKVQLAGRFVHDIRAIREPLRQPRGMPRFTLVAPTAIGTCACSRYPRCHRVPTRLRVCTRPLGSSCLTSCDVATRKALRAMARPDRTSKLDI